MHFAQIIALVSLALAGASASPGRRPSRPSRGGRGGVVVQKNECSNGSPLCCSPNDYGVFTCSSAGDGDVNVQCAGIQICCNNNDGDQDCSVGMKWDD